MKARVIMLETTNILKGEGLMTSDGKWFIRGNEFGCFVDNDTDVFQHHLYLIDEKAEIREGDWFVNTETNTVLQWNDLRNFPIGHFQICHKIIATTDNLPFTTDYHGEPETRVNKVCYTENVPKLSDESIKALISHYNKHGEHVNEVEVEDKIENEVLYHANGLSHAQNNLGKPRIIKLNPQGTVDIVLPKRDEVIGKPLEDYIREMNSQDKCIGFIDGWNACMKEKLK